MNPKVSTVGGTQAGMNFSDDFVSLLKGVMGGPGSAGASGGVAGFLNDLFSKGGGQLGGALGDMIGMRQTQDVNSIRSRFGASGGTSFGTPAAYAESTYRAHAAPEAATAIGGLQLGALAPLFSSFADVFNKNTAQRETMVQPSEGSQIMKIAGPILAAAATAFGGPVAGAAVGAATGAIGSSGSRSAYTLPSDYNPSLPAYNFGAIGGGNGTDWGQLLKMANP